MKVKYLLLLALMVMFAGLASTAFADPFVALQYNVPLTVTSVPVPNDFSGEAFSDVPTDFWAWAEILEASLTDTAATEGVVKGYGDGSFQNAFEVTRGMLAVFVANGLGLSPTAPSEPTFPDVPETYWAFGQIEAVNEAGIVRGYDDGLFRPATTVTRDQMAVFLVHAVAPGVTAPNSGIFSDVEDGFWAQGEIFECVDLNIALGYSDGTFKPAKAVTRDQMGVFVWRALIRLNGNSVVLGGPAVTDDAAFAPSGPGAAALFMPDELGGATGANIPLDADENPVPPAPGSVVFVVLDAAQVTDGDITFQVFHVDADDNEVIDDSVAVAVDAATAKAAVDASGGAPWMLASYEVLDTLVAGDYTLTVELPSGAVLTIADFTVE